MPLRVFLRSDKSPYWQIRGTVCGERVERSSGLTKEREAKVYAERVAAEIRARHIAGPQPEKTAELTFAKAVLNYLREPGRSPDAERFLEPLVLQFGTSRLSKIDQAAVDGYIRERHAGQAPATVARNTLTPLCAVLRHAGVKTIFRRPQVRPTKLRFLTEEEADRLLGAALLIRPLLAFCLHTGARMGEALALEWSNVSLTDRRVVFVDTKNGETRGVPLNATAWEALANLDYPTSNKDHDGRTIRAKIRHGRVFRTQTGADYVLKKNAGGQIKTAWKNACVKAGIKNASPHTMRHTFASWLVMKGVPLRTVAELMGHKTLNMVMRYSHLAPGHLASAVERLGGKSGETAPTKEIAQ